MKILYPLHVTGFDSLSENDNKEAETALEYIIYTIPYLENSYKSKFYDLKKRNNNEYVWNKAEYTRTVTVVKRLLLNYQPNYNYNRQSQSQGVIN